MDSTIKKALLFTLASSSLTGVALAKEKQPLQSRAALDNVRIVGGEESTPFAYPFMGSLQLFINNEYRHHCGSSLIAPDKVLTAAHCVEGRTDSQFAVKFGAHDLTDESQGQSYKVTSIVMHERYHNPITYSNDIAVLTLEAPVEGIAPIELADSELKRSYVVGENFKVMGWGALYSGGPSPDKLNEVDVPYISNEVCNDAQHYGGRISDSMLCAGFDEGQKDSCQGDSGGPLIVNRDNRWFQVGVVSWGDGCAHAYKPGVYADVAVLNDWVVLNQHHVEFESAYSMVPDKPIMSVRLSNQSSKPVEVSHIALTEQSAGVAIDTDNCAGKTVEPYQSCTVLMNIEQSEQQGEFTLRAELLNQDVVTREHTYNFEKTPATEADINAHTGTTPVIEWFSGGDATWVLGAETTEGGSAMPVLHSGNISDQQEDPSITTHSQKSVLIGEINHGLALGIDFEYLVSSEQHYDFFTVFLNGQQVVRHSGQSDTYEKVSYDLKKGSNTIAFVYSKDSSVSHGDDNAKLKGLNINIRENQSPTITLPETEFKIRSGMEITFDATGTSDLDGDSFTLAWTDVDAPETVLSTDEVYTLVAPVVSETQTQIFELTATDEYGATSKQRVTVIIDENKQPVINVAEASIEVRVGLEYTLDASGTTDPEGDTLSYTWVNLSNDASVSIGDTATMKLKAGDDQVGQTLVYQLTTQDAYGAKSSQLVTVKIVENQAPQAKLTVNSTLLSAGQNIELNASDSLDPEGDELTFSWEQVSGTSVNVSGSGAQMSAAAPSVDKNQVLEFAVTVTDSFGASSTETIKVTVEPPEKDSGSFGSFALLLMSLALFSRRMKK
ncbi:hypothetical protein C3B51_00120 [Pseudoalteromonas rubra]|uniref:Peptidase S1 domain-containing protein n=1 Tax=Pseudoalteromonas rubra TaxID=43658 RepID=A0A4V2E485_9GAMM|nr:serine protease [Pseudoalteromonas rubra]RZM85379.1 hypothetical protein C3B51_00120 [Pseudoalteromonas rubra]